MEYLISNCNTHIVKLQINTPVNISRDINNQILRGLSFYSLEIAFDDVPQPVVVHVFGAHRGIFR